MLPTFLLLLLGGASSVAPSQPQDDAGIDWASAIADLCREAVRAGDVSGLSVAVAIGGEVLVSDGYGYIDASRHVTARDDSIYAAGSFFEPLLATGVLLLADDGELDLEDELAKHLPAMDFGEPVVRVRHLLEHSSGIPSFSDFVRARGQSDLDEVMAFLSESTLDADPGTCFSYSNANTLLASLILKQVSGRSVASFLSDEVFDRAGLDGTKWCAAESPGGDFEIRQETGSWLVREVALPAPFSTARLCSSVLDLMRWQSGLARGELLSDAATRRMIGPVWLEDGTSTGAGYGLNHAPLEDFECQTFGGASGDSWMHAAYYPSASLSIALMASDADASLGAIERSIARVVLGLQDLAVRDLPLPPDQLARYAGVYLVGCNQLRVQIKGGGLEFVPLHGEPFLLRYQGGHLFVSRDDLAVRLHFEFEGEDNAVALVLTDRGSELRAIRIG